MNGAEPGDKASGGESKSDVWPRQGGSGDVDSGTRYKQPESKARDGSRTGSWRS